MKFPASTLLLLQHALVPMSAFTTKLPVGSAHATIPSGCSTLQRIGNTPICRKFHLDSLRVQSQRQRAESSNIADVRSTKINDPTVSTKRNMQPEIHVEESYSNQPLDEDSTIIFAARLDNYANNGIDGKEALQSNSTQQRIFDECKSTTDCEGYLIHRAKSNEFEVHLSTNGINAKDVDPFLAVFHKLLLRFVEIEHEQYETERDGYATAPGMASLSILLSGASMDKLLSRRLRKIGICSSPNENERSTLGIQLECFLPHLNEYVFRNRGTEQGNSSLQLLNMLSSRRMTFDFSSIQTDECFKNEENSPSKRRNLISYQKKVIPSSTIDKVSSIMDEIKSRQWLSTNPDSVDGLPSLHLNLITDGKPMFVKSDYDEGLKEATTSFPGCIMAITDALRPYLYNELLPTVRKLTNSPTIEVSDVFIRNYGVLDSEKGHTEGEPNGKTRYGLSPHYDVTAYATCVMTLDSTASSGKNGLYTIPSTDDGMSTNNAALKKFFPLERGDGVVHTYDVLHGVDVDPDLNQSRTSLIVWFVDRDNNRGQEGSDMNIHSNQPWLLNPVDDKGQFILGLASESRNAEEMNGNSSNFKSSINYSPLELYLSSASEGNIFAITRLGQMLCDEDVHVPEFFCDKIISIVRNFEKDNPFVPKETDTTTLECKDYANAFLYHAAIYGGNRAAQTSLGHELSLQYITEKSQLQPNEERDILLMAATLFSMAHGQGYDSMEPLNRLMEIECGRLHNMGIEIGSGEFFSQPVVQLLLQSIE